VCVCVFWPGEEAVNSFPKHPQALPTMDAPSEGQACACACWGSGFGCVRRY
jgi:hypothetical protein